MHDAKEKRLIDANALKQKQVKVCFDDDCENDGFGVVYVRHIDEAPTVDAVEVVHGRWIEKQEPIPWCEDDVEVYTVCSVCDSYSPCESNYCPNCGAKMDGDVGHDNS